MQRQKKSKQGVKHGQSSRKNGLGLDKLCIDDTIDEGYLSGNPPPLPTTQHPKSETSSDPGEVPTKPKMNKYKRNNNWTSGGPSNEVDSKSTTTTTRPSAASSVAAVDESATRPKMLPRSESRTFVFIYDEEEKKSKAVAAPDSLNVDVPVLLQYNLTEEAIEKCLNDKPQLGDSPTEDNGESRNSIPDRVVPPPHKDKSGGKFYPPTERLLRSREKDELKNKGMHVVKWLVNLDHSNEKTTDS